MLRRKENKAVGRVTFVPKDNTEYTDGWPNMVIGDGFIDLKLKESDHRADSAVYVDQFRDEYEFWCSSDGEWTVEVRED
jgi:hypothetical protein